jgi:hypothetical protein
MTSGFKFLFCELRRKILIFVFIQWYTYYYSCNGILDLMIYGNRSHYYLRVYIFCDLIEAQSIILCVQWSVRKDLIIISILWCISKLGIILYSIICGEWSYSIVIFILQYISKLIVLYILYSVICGKICDYYIYSLIY